MSENIENFDIGDLVQVKSGGPAMTVEGQSRFTGEYQCVWFNGNVKQYSSFPGTVLQTWTPPKEEDDLSQYE